MDARPILVTLARVFEEHGLEVIMVGNAAAALHGAPVTTIDIDFLFRKTRTNVRKLQSIAASLGGVLLRPYYPASDLYRLMRDDDSLQIDFMGSIHGVRSFESLRSRAKHVEFDGCSLMVASLADIIKSKKAAGRARDRAVLELLEKTLNEKENFKEGQT